MCASIYWYILYVVHLYLISVMNKTFWQIMECCMLCRVTRPLTEGETGHMSFCPGPHFVGAHKGQARCPIAILPMLNHTYNKTYNSVNLSSRLKNIGNLSNLRMQLCSNCPTLASKVNPRKEYIQLHKQQAITCNISYKVLTVYRAL